MWSRNLDLQVRADMLESRRLQQNTVRFLLSHTTESLKVTNKMPNSSEFAVLAYVVRAVSHDAAF